MSLSSFSATDSPLQTGLTLLEASAGTGKTYSLVRIIARQIVENQLPLEKILTVTFTRAATAEIKSRLQSLLQEILSQLQNPSPEFLQNDLAQKWHELPDEERADAIKALALALSSFDSAPIFTIDGFFQRLLKDYAFESNSLFSVELDPDENAMIDQAQRDYWRTHVYALDADAYQHFSEHITFSQAQGFLRETLRSPDAQLHPAYLLTRQQAEEGARQHYEQLRALVRDHHQALTAFLNAPPEGTNKRKNPYNKAGRTKFLEMVDAFLAGDDLALDAARVQALWQDLPSFREHPLAPIIQQLIALTDRPALDYPSSYLGHLYQYVQARLIELKTARNVQSYSDITFKLAALLSSNTSSAQAMIASVRKTYSSALIDEFQDTSPQQCQVFLQLFNHPEGFFHIIGDPKQSIYRFRGADVFAYINASERADHHAQLDTNFRSSPSMIHAINTLFQLSEDPFLVDQRIRFTPSRWPSQGDETTPLAPHPSLHLHLVDPSTHRLSQDQQTAIYDSICHEILALLDQPWQQIDPDSERTTPISPSDMAILVMSAREGKELYQRLSSLRIPAVTQTRTVLFQSAEAQSLCILLLAVLQPNRPQLIRSALLQPVLGAGSTLLDPDAIATATNHFATLLPLWRSHGLSPMLNTLVDLFSLHDTLLTQPLGLRALTNLLHLGEVLDHEARTTPLAPAETVRWLESTIQEVTRGKPQAEELRIDTDRPAVQIMTQHVSKGLEFPIVFVTPPCTQDFKAKQHTPDLSFHADDGRVHLAQYGETPIDPRRITETCADRARLAYVALTRAALRCHFYYRPPKQNSKGQNTNPDQHAVFRMLGEPELDTFDTLPQASSGCIVVQRIGDLAPPAAYIAPQDGTTAPSLTHRDLSDTSFTAHRYTSSFSGLTYNHQHHRAAAPPAVDQGFWAQLQAGAALGSAFHEILEEIDFQSPLQTPHLVDLITSKLQKHQPYPRHFSPTTLPSIVEEIRTYLHGLLHAPLSTAPDSPCLADIPASQRMIEPQFTLAGQGYSLSRLRDVLQTAPPTDLPSDYLHTLEALHDDTFQGFLTGFIDLVFQHDGRYHLLDWKTNRLPDYQPHTLAHAMAEHHYYLQYHLYTLALDRFLSLRLGAQYDPALHLGNVYYIFLRGIDPSTPGAGIYTDTVTPDRLATLRDTYALVEPVLNVTI